MGKKTVLVCDCCGGTLDEPRKVTLTANGPVLDAKSATDLCFDCHFALRTTWDRYREKVSE